MRSVSQGSRVPDKRIFRLSEMGRVWPKSAPNDESHLNLPSEVELDAARRYMQINIEEEIEEEQADHTRETPANWLSILCLTLQIPFSKTHNDSCYLGPQARREKEAP